MVMPSIGRSKLRKRRRRRHREHGFLPLIALIILLVLVIVPTTLVIYRGDSPGDPHRVFIPPSQRLRPGRAGTGILENQQWSPLHLHNTPATKNDEMNPTQSRYLIFRPPLEAAQGVGNLMNGLLAAHILGNEFNRTVCVSEDWKEFDLAFRSLHKECQESFPRRTSRNTIWLLNFSKKPMNECDLKSRLQGSEEPTIYLVANTYPRWPTFPVEEDVTRFFLRFENYYRLRPALLHIIPWSEAPSTVVHLRQADNTEGDYRVGLDSNTRAALGAFLPKDTYLVTNQIAFYGYFASNFGWSHPSWTGIRHSAISNVQWTTTTTNATMSTHRDQILQSWADWWTLYQAPIIYHTYSDFSASASRWSQTSESYVIGGLDATSQLILQRESWWTGKRWDVVEPLSKRTATGLQHCDISAVKPAGIGYVLDLDDAMHDDLMDDWKTTAT